MYVNIKRIATTTQYIVYSLISQFCMPGDFNDHNRLKIRASAHLQFNILQQGRERLLSQALSSPVICICMVAVDFAQRCLYLCYMRG